MDKTFDPENIEGRHYQEWELSGVFSCNPQSNAEPYCIMMPPPNVTGSLHMGHALNGTLQDVLIRYNRMRGRDALWQPGTDHAGIATQMVVERKLQEEGLPHRRELGRENFLKRVWDWKEESGGTIVRQMRALGTTPDWARERFTMDEGLSQAVLKVFVQLHKEGLIYRDKRLVNWDTKLLTAISDLEVEEREQKGHMWHLRYPIEGETADYITVATTRPETMLGDTAVAVHPDDERYKHLIGKFVVLPIVERMIPIIADEYANPEKGSGAVKITPAHDFNDFEVGKRHDLPMISIFDMHGCLNENVPEGYRGLDRFEARKKILAELDQTDLLAEVENIVHAIPYGDRSGTIIEPFLTDQWYVNAAEMAKPAIKAVEEGKTVFVPENWTNTYYQWMRNIQPWCISRQLWWGHQIPAWYGANAKNFTDHSDYSPSEHHLPEIFVAETEEEALKLATEYYSRELPRKVEVIIGLGNDRSTTTQDNVSTFRITRDEDVLDTWFSSALWPFSTLGWPEQTPELSRYYPTDVLITGFDIIFFWVARMMMMGLHFMDDVPFRTVYVHALVRDEKGQKMSKSKGNVMDPLEITQKYGADALRFTLVAMAAQGRDVRLSEERIEGYRNFATKIWNATRYCEMNDCLKHDGFDPASAAFIPNQWIIGETAKAQAAIDKAIGEYRFNDSADAIYRFVYTFCDWYLEFTKPLLQESSPHTAEIRQTTAWVLEQILILLNPFMPFITEEIYAVTGLAREGERLIGSDWPTYKLPDNKEAVADMGWLMRTISEIRSVRKDRNVPAGAKVPLLVKEPGAAIKARLSAYEEILFRLARIESIEFVSAAPKGAIQTVVDDTVLILPIAGFIDVEKEKLNIEREIEKVEADIGKIDKQLGNERFVANAPEEIVAEQRARKAELESKLDKLRKAREDLS